MNVRSRSASATGTPCGAEPIERSGRCPRTSRLSTGGTSDRCGGLDLPRVTAAASRRTARKHIADGLRRGGGQSVRILIELAGETLRLVDPSQRIRVSAASSALASSGRLRLISRVLAAPSAVRAASEWRAMSQFLYSHGSARGISEHVPFETPHSPSEQTVLEILRSATYPICLAVVAEMSAQSKASSGSDPKGPQQGTHVACHAHAAIPLRLRPTRLVTRTERRSSAAFSSPRRSRLTRIA
jgi:hypothetical protein